MNKHTESILTILNIFIFFLKDLKTNINDNALIIADDINGEDLVKGAMLHFKINMRQHANNKATDYVQPYEQALSDVINICCEYPNNSKNIDLK